MRALGRGGYLHAPENRSCPGQRQDFTQTGVTVIDPCRLGSPASYSFNVSVSTQSFFFLSKHTSTRVPALTPPQFLPFGVCLPLNPPPSVSASPFLEVSWKEESPRLPSLLNSGQLDSCHHLLAEPGPTGQQQPPRGWHLPPGGPWSHPCTVGCLRAPASQHSVLLICPQSGSSLSTHPLQLSLLEVSTPSSSPSSSS